MTQEFGHAMEEALTGGFKEPSSMSTFGKKPVGKKVVSKANIAKTGSSAKKRTQNVKDDCLAKSNIANVHFEADVQTQSELDKTVFPNGKVNGEVAMDIAGADEDDDDVFLNFLTQLSHFHFGRISFIEAQFLTHRSQYETESRE